MPLARPTVGYRKGNALRLRWRSVALDCALLEGSASPRIGNWVPAQTGTPLMARGLVGSESDVASIALAVEANDTFIERLEEIAAQAQRTIESA